MSKKNNNINKTIQIIRHPIFSIHHKNINECIKTQNKKEIKFDNMKKPAILKYIKNNLISKAIQKKNCFNQVSKSTFVEENLIFNEFKYFPNLKPNPFNNRKNVGEKRASFFNNIFLNQKYHKIDGCPISLTKVKNQYLKLNNIYNPNRNYSEVVNDRKHIIKVLLSQTKNNFNNNYYLVYSSPDVEKRNYISKCFETIKNNSKKNIDQENSINVLAEKEIFNRAKSKIFKVSKKIKNNNICISIPSAFDIKNYIPKSCKFNVKTLNIADKILKEHEDPLKIKKNKRLVKSALFQPTKSESNDFFRTIPKQNVKIGFAKDSKI